MLEEVHKMTEKSMEMLDRLRRNAIDGNIKNAVMMYKAGIITCDEARYLLGLEPIKEVEFQSSSLKFQFVKAGRNRYDYLKRKLNDGKHFTQRDEKDFITLHKMFEVKIDENTTENTEIKQNSDKNSDAQTRINTEIQTNSDKNISLQTAEKSLQSKEELTREVTENIKKIDDMIAKFKISQRQNQKPLENEEKHDEISRQNPKKWVSIEEFGKMVGVANG